MNERSQRRETTACQPSRSCSRKRDDVSATAPGRGLMRQMQAALTTKLPASIAIALPGPNSAISAPASGGAEDEAAGLRHRHQRVGLHQLLLRHEPRHEPAGRGAEERLGRAVDARPAPRGARSRRRRRSAASPPAPARPRARGRRRASRRWRDTRSPTTPPTSASAASGSPCAASTSPRLDAEPDSSSTANASATGNSASPTIEIALPLNSSAKSRLRRAAALRRVVAATGGEAASTNDSCSSAPVSSNTRSTGRGPWMNSTRQPRSCALAAELQQRAQAEAVDEGDAPQVDRGRVGAVPDAVDGARELVDGGEVDLALARRTRAPLVESSELQHPEERLLLLH